MSKGLFCHDVELQNINIDMYDYLFIIKTSSSQNRVRHQHSEKIFYIDLSQYFIKAHQKTRSLNKILLKYNNSDMFLSLLKSSDRILFENVRYILILQELYDEYKFNDIEICLENKELFNEIVQLMNISFKFNLAYKSIQVLNAREIIGVRFLYRVAKLSKYLYYFLKDTKSKRAFKMILLPYYSSQSYENIAHFDNQNALVYPLISDNDRYGSFHNKIHHLQEQRLVTLKWYKSFFTNCYKSFQKVDRMDLQPAIKRLFLKRVIDLEFHNVLYQSVVDIYHPEVMIGQFDATSYIDYITKELNDVGIKTVCIPHGVNFKYKVNYISQGVNSYRFWSKEHKKQFDENVLISNSDNDTIDGFSGFRDMKDRYLKEKDDFSTEQKSILIIGEYFSKDNFYTSPFNYATSKRLFEKLKEYALTLKISITVRTRLDDDYHHLALEYQRYGIKISSPEKKDIFEEIMEHDLIVSVFSNALHESLLLRKKTLQVNFLGIENYRNLADRGLVYYARDEKELDVFMSRYMEDALDTLNFDVHEEEYCNGSVLGDYID